MNNLLQVVLPYMSYINLDLAEAPIMESMGYDESVDSKWEMVAYRTDYASCLAGAPFSADKPLLLQAIIVVNDLLAGARHQHA